MAYGAIAAPVVSAPLPTLAYALPSSKQLVVFPLTLETTPDGLRAWMTECFRAEVESAWPCVSLLVLLS